jgi:hypothetical protein
MGFISLSYLFGDAAARGFMGWLIGHGLGWRGVFLACAYRKSHPTFRRLHLQELSIDTTNWHSEFSFPGPASFIWLSSLFSFSLLAPFLRLDWN